MTFKYLKTDPAPFQAVWDGHKTAELRYDDRAYVVGDHLVLMETRYSSHDMGLATETDANPYPLGYTGREILVKITHVLRDLDGVYGLKSGWCILSHEVLSKVSDVPGEV